MEWGPIKPAAWPQDTLRIPQGNTRFMPPVYKGNAQTSRQESFTMFGTFALGIATTAGQQFRLSLPTDQDGDFWCDQIYMVAWWPVSSALGFNPFPGVLTIADFRTGRELTYPPASVGAAGGGVPGEFFKTFVLFPDDVGFDPASSPFPDGFRSTATLPTPFCFTRQGGIQMTYTTPNALTFGANPASIDIAFGGWKEYTYAAQGEH